MPWYSGFGALDIFKGSLFPVDPETVLNLGEGKNQLLWYGDRSGFGKDWLIPSHAGDVAFHFRSFEGGDHKRELQKEAN